MKNKIRIAAGVLFVCAALMPPGAKRLLADQNDRPHQIGAKLKCMCNGCDQSAAKCYHVGGAYSGPCDTAKTMLKEIDANIGAGLNDQQVLDAMIKQYGPLAYVEPPKSGFGLVAWIMPVLYLFGGLALVIMVMNRWRKRPVAVAVTPGVSGLQVSPELLARAREQAQRETEE
ncbi:MAG TPA: cytochrome c-type biogenesis protein CcmH [Candidatus Acidoferrum sp.]|jgi:cytochrome c-type biogenesis protein CcmH/NrfF